METINPINRQVVLDTETTGMNQFGLHYEGHRVIEIGAVEIINRKYTGKTFHVYIKPDRLVDPEAIKIHGITDEFLADKPDFSSIAEEFIEFIKDAELLIHNASFDVGFLDYEFSKLGKKIKTNELCTVTDTLQIARQTYPGKRNSLDALCDRLDIDNSRRTLHGALLDAQILGDVYLAMTGGQKSLFIDEEEEEEENKEIALDLNSNKKEDEHEYLELIDIEQYLDLLTIDLDAEEKLSHQQYCEYIHKKSKGKCIWIKRTENGQQIELH